MASDTRAPTKARAKVALKPGFHLADWMRLTKMGNDLSGLKGGPLRQITKEELAEHSSRYDCWTSYHGKVYNLTTYMDFHPGGDEILMEAAGKDCTDLVVKYHRWVNVESMMAKTLIGTLVDSSIEGIAEEDEEEADKSKHN